MQRSDILVCGCGPAGVTVASLHKGEKVTVLDPNPFYKPCGELVLRQEADAMGAEVMRRASRIEVRTPYGSREFRAETAMIDKVGWMERTLERSGAELVRTRARLPLTKAGSCVGVEADTDYTAATTYDCTGAARALASRFGAASEREFAVSYEETVPDTGTFDLPLAYYDERIAPGGYCIAPDSPIVCKNSLKAVSEVKLGDEVLTSVGWMPVSGTSVRDYQGELVAITPSMLNEEIRLTPDHLVRVWNPRTGEGWKRAGDLEPKAFDRRHPKDYLVLPLPSQPASPLEELDALKFVDGIVEEGYVHVAIKRSFFDGSGPGGLHRRKFVIAKHPKGTRLPQKIKLDEKFLEFCGWYVSEGCMKKNHVNISNANPEMIERISRLSRSLGYNFVKWTNRGHGRRECYNVLIPNSLLGRLMSSCFGRGARNKKLPSWIHEIPTKSKMAFLTGYALGDGGIFHRKGIRSDAWEFTTASRALAVDLWLLMASVKIIASIKKNKGKNAWSLGVFGHQASLLGGNLYLAPRRTSHGFSLGEGRVYLAIRRYNRIPYSGPVHDLNSAGDFTPLFNVHNCWNFPRGDGTAYIGLLAWPWVSSLRERLRLFATRTGLSSGTVMSRKGSRIFLGFPRQPPVKGLFVVGEANGSCDPFTGSGIFQAIMDARKQVLGERRRSGMLRKLSAFALRNIPAAYLQLLEAMPVPFVQYYP